jgi:hypothetical protein
MVRDADINHFKAQNPTALARRKKTLREVIAGRPFAFVGTHEGLHIVIEGESQVYHVQVCPEEEAQLLADNANRELGLSEVEVEWLIEQNLRQVDREFARILAELTEFLTHGQKRFDATIRAVAEVVRGHDMA